jgi:hypothetical protein
MDINRSDVIGDRRLRLANSSPDVKALFNSPAGHYLYEDHDPPEQSYLPQGPSGGALMEYWTQPTQLAPIVSHLRCLVPLRHPTASHFFFRNQGSGIPGRTRHTEDAIKRGSDSLLEAKLKNQLTKPRSLTNRAQSLDLTYSLSRITESGSGMIPPDSPTTSTAGGDTGGNSSPISGTAPSFPSVYGPPMTVAPQPTGLTSCNTGIAIPTTGISTTGTAASGVTVGRLSGNVGTQPGTSSTSGTTIPSHQGSGRTPDDDDVSKMFSSLGL